MGGDAGGQAALSPLPALGPGHRVVLGIPGTLHSSRDGWRGTGPGCTATQGAVAMPHPPGTVMAHWLFSAVPPHC